MSMIVLLGYMGSGKSSVGQQLASQLSCQFMDLDEVIEKHEGLSIAEIFKSKGEIYFRKKETEYLKRLLETKEQIVLALGGGTPCYGNNMNLIKGASVISIYLKASIPTLIERLKTEKGIRPLISHLKTEDELAEFIGKHLFERQNFYLKSEHVVVTDNKAVKAIVTEIKTLI